MQSISGQSCSTYSSEPWHIYTTSTDIQTAPTADPFGAVKLRIWPTCLLHGHAECCRDRGPPNGAIVRASSIQRQAPGFAGHPWMSVLIPRRPLLCATHEIRGPPHRNMCDQTSSHSYLYARAAAHESRHQWHQPNFPKRLQIINYRT